MSAVVLGYNQGREGLASYPSASYTNRDTQLSGTWLIRLEPVNVVSLGEMSCTEQVRLYSTSSLTGILGDSQATTAENGNQFANFFQGRDDQCN